MSLFSLGYMPVDIVFKTAWYWHKKANVNTPVARQKARNKPNYLYGIDF